MFGKLLDGNVSTDDLAVPVSAGPAERNLPTELSKSLWYLQNPYISRVMCCV